MTILRKNRFLKITEFWKACGVDFELPAPVHEGLEEAMHLCERHLPPKAYEIKPASIIVYGKQEHILAAFEVLASTLPLKVHHFDEGFEIRYEH